MIFSELIFLFAFLPVYLALSFSCHESWTKNLLTVAASLLFIVWGRQWYYALIILPIFLIYLSGIVLKRKKSPLVAAFGGLSAAVYAVWAVTGLSSDITLRSALLSVGILLFALRGVSYLSEISGGAEPERDPVALAVYLISFENMLIAPLSRYSRIKDKLKNRRPSLKKLSEGLSACVFGFAKTAVFGLAFDKVRLAAAGGVLPWFDAVVLVVSTIFETYIVAAGILEMSRGIGLMNGFSPCGQVSAIFPARSLSRHIYELWDSLPGFVDGLAATAAGKAVVLALTSVMTGVFIGAGAYAGAFFGIILMAVMIERLFAPGSAPADILLSALALFAAFVTLSSGSAGGYSGLFSAFDTQRYDFDISFALNKELSKSLPLLIAGALFVSPLYRAAVVWYRRKKQEMPQAYGALRIAETVLGALLLAAGIAASL